MSGISGVNRIADWGLRISGRCTAFAARIFYGEFAQTARAAVEQPLSRLRRQLPNLGEPETIEIKSFPVTWPVMTILIYY